MAIVSMNKISLIGFEEEKEMVLDILLHAGDMQIEKTDTNIDEATFLESDSATEEIDQIDGFLKKIHRVRDALSYYDQRKKNVFEPKTDLSKDQYRQYVTKQAQIFEEVDKIDFLIIKKENLKNEKNLLANEIEVYLPWEGLDANLAIDHTQSTKTQAGVIPNTVDIESLKVELEEKFPQTSLTIVSSDNVQHYIFLIIHNSIFEECSTFLRTHGFSKSSFKDANGSASENIKRLRSEMDILEKKYSSISKEIEEYKGNIEEVEVLYDYLLQEKVKKSERSKFKKTDSIFYVEGWVPEKKVSKLVDKLKKETEVYCDIRPPKEDEEFPILVENPAFIKPFELITELFSLPNSKEFDVNPFMAPFYFAFFGLMLSDAGYGLVLALITGFILHKYELKGTMKKMISMIFFGGISTFIWGALFGGWFGDIVDKLSQGQYTIPPLWFNPVKDPMRLLIWSCVFGVIQLYTGMALQGYKMWCVGKKIDAILDVGLRYMYYSGVILLLVGLPIAKYITIIGVVGLLLTQGRDKKGFGKITGGLLSLYDFVGFMSDVLSYSRLLALGLATGVVASVINTMGTIAGFNFIGIILLIVVFIGGHIFNILINALGAYVHASRLQYVEFFSKFYEGGGKAYTPLKINTKYININN